MMTREQQAQHLLEAYRRHRQAACEDFQQLEGLHYNPPADGLAAFGWEHFESGTVALVRSDSARLLNAVQAVLDLANSDIPPTRNGIYNAVFAALKGGCCS